MTAASSPTPLSDAEAEAKRIRNTAASARFRRKKKAREASLERQSREKREALAKLENRITELEDENKFLKGLILWKKEGKEEDTDNGAEESIVVEPERKGRERKDGVGT
jgi:cell shape-determining protein MreC